MAKNNKIKRKKTNALAHPQDVLWLGNDRIAFIVCCLFALSYFVFSIFSDGFYQQDELAHYISMRGFWNDPNSILSNWAKPGYKLIFIWPALLGVTALKVFNIALSVSIGYLTYLIGKKLGLKYSLLALFLLLSQPFWILLSFRNYSEHLTAFFYLLGLYFLIDKKYILTAIVISYGCFLRQETYPLAILFTGYMFYKKQFLPILLLLVFPVFQNIWGWIATGNANYLLDMMTGTSAEYASMYPRQGFNHYFLMSPVIFGYIVTIFAVAYLIVLIFQKKWPPISSVFVWIVLLGFAAQHVVFNSQFLDIGPSTGGNLRYFNVIAPLTSLCALMGIEKILDLKNRKLILGVIAILSLVVLYYTTFEHNYIKYIDVRNWNISIPLLVVLALLYLDFDKKVVIYGVIFALVIQSFLMVKPLKLQGEDLHARSIAKYIINNSKKSTYSVATSHATCQYYLYDNTSFIPFRMKDFNKLQSGDWVIWDSHYSPRNKIEYKELVEDKERFVLVKQDITDDKRFATLLFQRK